MSFTSSSRRQDTKRYTIVIKQNPMMESIYTCLKSDHQRQFQIFTAYYPRLTSRLSTDLMLSLIQFSNTSDIQAVDKLFVKVVLISESLFLHIQALNSLQTEASFLTDDRSFYRLVFMAKLNIHLQKITPYYHPC